MSIIVNTPNSTALLRKLQDAIDDEQIRTWSYDSHSFLYHAPQYEGKAHFELRSVDRALRFELVPPSSRGFDDEIYGVYHGHFAQMFLNHFSDDLTSVELLPE